MITSKNAVIRPWKQLDDVEWSLLRKSQTWRVRRGKPAEMTEKRNFQGVGRLRRIQSKSGRLRTTALETVRGYLIFSQPQNISIASKLLTINPVCLTNKFGNICKESKQFKPGVCWHKFTVFDMRQNHWKGADTTGWGLWRNILKVDIRLFINAVFTALSDSLLIDLTEPCQAIHLYLKKISVVEVF